MLSLTLFKIVTAYLFSNFVAMVTWVSRSILSCLTSFSSPTRKTKGAKILEICHISYTSQVIADFVSEFVAMATGVIQG